MPCPLFPCPGRRGEIHPVVIGLLALVAVLGAALAWSLTQARLKPNPPITATEEAQGPAPLALPPQPQGPATPPSSAALAQPGQAVRRDRAQPGPMPEAPVAQARFLATYPAGRRYQSRLTATFEARAEDRSWAVLHQVITLVYVGECVVDRRIVSNDGSRLVEERTFTVMRNAKLLTEAQVTVQIGQGGALLLAALDQVYPGSGQAAIAAKAVTEQVARGYVTAVAQDQAAKAVGFVDGLQGKSFRIAYRNDDQLRAVEEITPLNGAMSEQEFQFLMATAVASDCYVMPDLDRVDGASWEVHASQLAGLIDPTLRARPSGTVRVVREAEQTVAGEPMVRLRVGTGVIQLDASDELNRRVGSFTPQGQLWMSKAHGIVTEAQLEGLFRVEQVSRDHILFESSFRSQPRLKVLYSCRLLTAQEGAALDQAQRMAEQLRPGAAAIGQQVLEQLGD